MACCHGNQSSVVVDAAAEDPQLQRGESVPDLGQQDEGGAHQVPGGAAAVHH